MDVSSGAASQAKESVPGKRKMLTQKAMKVQISNNELKGNLQRQPLVSNANWQTSSRQV